MLTSFDEMPTPFDPASSPELIRRHLNPCWRLALAAASTVEDAEAAVRSAFARDDQAPERELRAWLLARVIAALEPATDGTAALVSVAAGLRPGWNDETKRSVVAAFARLGRTERVAIWLVDVEAHDDAEAAAIIGIGVVQVRKLLRTARPKVLARTEAQPPSTSDSKSSRAIPDGTGPILRSVVGPAPAGLAGKVAEQPRRGRARSHRQPMERATRRPSPAHQIPTRSQQSHRRRAPAIAQDHHRTSLRALVDLSSLRPKRSVVAACLACAVAGGAFVGANRASEPGTGETPVAGTAAPPTLDLGSSTVVPYPSVGGAGSASVTTPTTPESTGPDGSAQTTAGESNVFYPASSPVKATGASAPGSEGGAQEGGGAEAASSAGTAPSSSGPPPQTTGTQASAPSPSGGSSGSGSTSNSGTSTAPSSSSAASGSGSSSSSSNGSSPSSSNPSSGPSGSSSSSSGPSGSSTSSSGSSSGGSSPSSSSSSGQSPSSSSGSTPPSSGGNTLVCQGTYVQVIGCGSAG